MNPNYYAIIPANVRYAKINANAKLLYGEITALANKEGFCFATNKYFADLYQVDARTIQRWVKELIDNNFIYVQIIDFEKRKIYLSSETKMSYPPDKNVIPTPDKNVTHNNTSINNTKNSYSENSKIDEIKANPIFNLNRKSKFASLTDQEIDLTLQTALVDNPKLSFASAINWLANEQKTRDKNKSKEQIYKENTQQTHWIDKFQEDNETDLEFEARIKELEVLTGSKYRLHYKGSKNSEFEKLKSKLLKSKTANYD